MGGCSLAVVGGSGLGTIAEVLEGVRALPFAELASMPPPSVPGHPGRFVLGELDGARILVQQGRLHLYEGWSVHELVRSIRAFALLEIRGVLLTNAAGGLRASWPPGSLMRITDHLNLQRLTPLTSRDRAAGNPYDPGLGRAFERAAAEAGVELMAGVYAGLPGPAYETPAEIRMLERLGADAVGMSTVLEACAARASGLRVAGLSLIANSAAGVAAEPIAHDQVLAAAEAAGESLSRLARRALPELARELARGGSERR